MLKRFRLFDWALAVLIIFTWTASTAHCGSNNDIGNVMIFDDIDTSSDYPNDSLPHYMYKRISDSIAQLQSWKKAASNARGEGSSYMSLGYGEINKKFYRPGDATEKPGDRSYYLALSGYKLEPNSEFYIDNDKWLIKTPHWDSTVGDYKYGHYVLKSSPVRYSFTKGIDELGGEVLVPSSKGKLQVVKIFTGLLFVATLGFSVYILFALVMIMARIINKKSFSEMNYRSLVMIGIYFIVFSFLPFLIGLFMNLIFHNKIPDEINYPFWENLLKYKGYTLAGLIILLIARAFKQGHELQTENESIV